MANLFTSYRLLFFFCSLYFSFITSSVSDKLPSTFAATQTKFWSENVKNEMPAAISTKLSPLTQLHSDYYAQAISQKSFEFNADTKFCSLARLACTASFNQIPNGNKNYARTFTRIFYGAQTMPLENVDPFSFFRSSSLKQGGTIHLTNLKETLPHRAFLPPRIASGVSFTTKGITKLFPDSPKDAVETALSFCRAAAVEGEVKSCPKSLEEMIGFSKTTLRASKLVSLTSKNTAGSDRVLMIGAVKQFDVNKFVACHEIFLPFATYYCHSIVSSQIYTVDLIKPETRAPVNTAVAVCHMDTSKWLPEHVAFKMLKFGPGQGEICHWMNEIDLAWIKADVDVEE